MHRLCKYGDSCCTGKSHAEGKHKKWCGHANWRCLWLPQSWIVVDERGIQKAHTFSELDPDAETGPTPASTSVPNPYGYPFV